MFNTELRRDDIHKSMSFNGCFPVTWSGPPHQQAARSLDLEARFNIEEIDPAMIDGESSTESRTSSAGNHRRGLIDKTLIVTCTLILLFTPNTL